MSELIIGTDENEGYWYTGEVIVRCRDCKNYEPKDGTWLNCRFEIDGFVQWRYAEPDGFCKWSEKKGRRMSKDKRQLRAEAVERLKGINSQSTVCDILYAVCGKADYRIWDATQDRDALIDLLTDDERPEQIVIEEPDTIRNEFEDNGLLVDDEAEQDSREKLEADACEFVRGAWHAGRRFALGDMPDGWNSDELIALLDRQAAITKAEQRDWWGDVVAELTAERDELKAELTHFERFKNKVIPDLRAERDELRAQVAKLQGGKAAYRELG